MKEGRREGRKKYVGGKNMKLTEGKKKREKKSGRNKGRRQKKNE